jgi:hypothetical protein
MEFAKKGPIDLLSSLLFLRAIYAFLLGALEKTGG